MPSQRRKPLNTDAPPMLGPKGHPLPRRASPGHSVTLKHHQLARDASLRASPGSSPAANASTITSPPRRNSSGESHETAQSDPKNWFDQSNENPTAMFDNNNNMDLDPPFFQKESDSSNEDIPYQFQNPPPPRLATEQSSSAGDYRSVIDDLTIEIQKLKEELKRYKQKGPEMLRKDKLFEIKYHGLPKRKRRELETTLRDFAAGVEDSLDASSSQRKKSSRHATRDHMYSASGSASKHASSSSGSHARPVDSAYASMSSGANSAGMSHGRSTANSRLKSDQKVENYLRDIPEGLYPRHMILTDRDRKKLVVRRLEQLFTGKLDGRQARQARKRQPDGSIVAEITAAGVELQPQSITDQHTPAIHTTTAVNTVAVQEPLREAMILPAERSGSSLKKSQSRDNGSASNSNGDRTESGGNGNSSGSGTNTSPTQAPVPDQRPTRVKDLDPDRTQVPSENMDYIRHLGLVPPELVKESDHDNLDVHPDADGWVYLNLLCSLAQLHIINVTPSFVRSAVAEISTRFQLSPDGRKIRWRGGQDGTRFSSDSSDENLRNSPGVEDSDSGQHKRQKTRNSAGDDNQSGGSSKSRSKFGPLVSTSSDSFHYKPLFVHNSSPDGEISFDETLSSFGPVEDSNVDDSRWGLSGSGTSNRRKRRHDGAIIYYSGAPFCTDLSGDPGDPGDTSPATYMLSSGQDRQDSHSQYAPPLERSVSGSSLPYRPFSGTSHSRPSGSKADIDIGECLPSLTTESESESSIIDDQFPWVQGQQFIEIQSLEPCGLGGVMPDDHFMVVVTTKRPTKDNAVSESRYVRRQTSEEATECIIGRLAGMSTSSPAPAATSQPSAYPVEIEYMSGRIKRLAPVPLPPPVIFLPPFSTDTSSMGDDAFTSEDDQDVLESSEEPMSRAVNPHQSDGYPDGVDLSSGDEDGEEPDEDDVAHVMYDRMDTHDGSSLERSHFGTKRPSIGSAEATSGSLGHRSKSTSADRIFRTGGSSAATAGGIASHSSPDEES